LKPWYKITKLSKELLNGLIKANDLDECIAEIRAIGFLIDKNSMLFKLSKII
jgi:hypothetical protein